MRNTGRLNATKSRFPRNSGSLSNSRGGLSKSGGSLSKSGGPSNSGSKPGPKSGPGLSKSSCGGGPSPGLPRPGGRPPLPGGPGAGGSEVFMRSLTFSGIAVGKPSASPGSSSAADTFRDSARGLMASFHWERGRSRISDLTESPNARSRSPAEPLRSESRPRPNCQPMNPPKASARISRCRSNQPSTFARSGK
ncbi:MAG: hypothetical protein EOP88_24275 [Verrucomicrobiaceae bacterium]|nr:MAG: hypothetical protein EOP88_24275 [Verrucomicrobiaceae bacterium]